MYVFGERVLDSWRRCRAYRLLYIYVYIVVIIVGANRRCSSLRGGRIIYAFDPKKPRCLRRE